MAAPEPFAAGRDRAASRARLWTPRVIPPARARTASEDPRVIAITTLRCAECGRVEAEGERGWRALLGQEDDDTVDVEVFCPECAEREFGPPR